MQQRPSAPGYRGVLASRAPSSARAGARVSATGIVLIPALLGSVILLGGCAGGRSSPPSAAGVSPPQESASRSPAPASAASRITNASMQIPAAVGSPNLQASQTDSQSAAVPAAGEGAAINPVLAHYRPRPEEFLRGSPTRNEVALTFDAGLVADGVPLILKTLAEHHLRCTFFLTGKFCRCFPNAARAIADAGMELGNHSLSHPDFTHLSSARIREQLDRAQEILLQTCGRGSRPLFRFPYGADNRRALNVVAADGYQPIYWTLDSLDSVGRPKSAEFVSQRIISRIQPGYITLMHVSYLSSAEALPAILNDLDSPGDLRVVPVSTLLLNEHTPEPIIIARK